MADTKTKDTAVKDTAVKSAVTPGFITEYEEILGSGIIVKSVYIDSNGNATQPTSVHVPDVGLVNGKPKHKSQFLAAKRAEWGVN